MGSILQWKAWPPYCLIALVMLLAGGCTTTDTGSASPNEVREQRYVPRRGVVRARMTARTAQGKIDVSRLFYVFPPLRLDTNYQPMDQFSYGVDEQGRLFWVSPAPASVEIRQFIENELRKASFQTITFDSLTQSETSHQILVLNPYFSVPVDDRSTGGKIVFVRVTIATYPADLDPAGRREIINLEGLSMYHPDDDYIKVIEITLQQILLNIGMNRDWMQDLSMNSR